LIALYKIDGNLADQISFLFQRKGIKVTYFYALKSLLDQMMNPFVILTPLLFAKELKGWPVPVLPLSIHWEDVVQELVQWPESSTDINFVASREEIEWLEWEKALIGEKEADLFVRKIHFMASETVKMLNGQTLVPAWEKRFASQSGSRFTVHTLVPSLSNLSSVVQQACSLLDYTTEMAREKVLSEAIVNSSHDGVIAVNRDGLITLTNDHAKTMLGLQGDVIGNRITDFIPHSDMIRVLETGKREIGDLATVMDRQILINRFPVMVNGRVVGAVSNFKEITDIQKTELRLRKMLHQKGLDAKYRLSDIIGCSKEISEIKEQAETFAKTRATVLITGESGTGKEMFAQGIHLASDRAAGPFVAINCAALPESLLESELFGYEEGSFTGAKRGGKQGLFELAHGGTLFLDEIGEMPPRIQALLLRVLQEKTVRRIGGEKLIPVDVRIVAATNRDLAEEIEYRRFRPDLYYRLNVLTLQLPPLRQRLGDLPDLVQHILERFNEQTEKKIEAVHPDVFTLLKSYHWPGNIRELNNVMERMVLLEKGSVLTTNNLSFLLKKPANITNLKEAEREMIRNALAQFHNNKTLAAKSLGMDRTTLWRKLREYQM
jgi:transcriptional regulator, propionate catabolism operon regulatory protein